MTKVEFPLVDVLRLRPLEDSKLWLRFTDGCEGVRDLSDVLGLPGSMVQPLKDPTYFQRVFIESGVPTWPNGFDLDPIQLYLELKAAGALSAPKSVAPIGPKSAKSPARPPAAADSDQPKSSKVAGKAVRYAQSGEVGKSLAASALSQKPRKSRATSSVSKKR